MRQKQLHLIYFSPTGTTGKIVTAIGEALWEGEIPVCRVQDWTKKRPTEGQAFVGTDLVILGVPVYGGRIPLLLEEAIRGLKGNGALCVAAVVYGNRAYEDALLELTDLLTEGGFRILGAGAFLGEHSYGKEIAGGRPDAQDLVVAADFGKRLLEKLLYTKKAEELAAVSVPGNHPYKERNPGGEPWAPKTRETCVDCGICAGVCPMGIIDASDVRQITAPEKCLHCCACVKACPLEAKYMDSAFYEKFRSFLIANYSKERKEPEMFL